MNLAFSFDKAGELIKYRNGQAKLRFCVYIFENSIYTILFCIDSHK